MGVLRALLMRTMGRGSDLSCDNMKGVELGGNNPRTGTGEMALELHLRVQSSLSGTSTF
jgi:hypothetical protein